MASTPVFPNDLPIRQGDSFTTIFEFLDGDGNPFDLTGSTLTWRSETSVEGIYLEKSTPTDFAMPTPTNGRATLSLDPEETNQLSPGRVNRFQVRRSIGGEVTTLVAGYDVVEEDVEEDA